MIVPIVEGYSEVESLPLLMRRVLDEQGAHALEIHKPIRVKRTKIVKEGEIERTVELAKITRPGARAIMFVLDADDDCPKELAPQLLERAGLAADGYLVCSVVLPKREFESWFIASIESLRNQRVIREDALPPDDPENVKDAKGWLTSAMSGRIYVQTDDQPAFAHRFDFNSTHARCRSFRKFRKDFLGIVSALTGGS